MDLLNFENHAIWINFAVFALASGIVWVAGVRVTRYADAIAKKTGVGHVAVGLVLLGGITSLPEIAVAVVSALAAAPALAVNNLLGGVAMQKAILAGVDGFIGRDALTVISASPSVLLQAALGTIVLVLVAAAIVTGDVLVGGIGVWAWGILFAYVFAIWNVSTSEGHRAWEPKDVGVTRPEPSDAGTGDAGQAASSLALKTALCALAILAAGFFLSRTGDAIAVQSGLGQSFVGVALLSLATSLPELSTVTTAMRLRQYELAISDILGTNLFNVMLIFLVDAVYGGGPVLNEVGNFSLFAALLCILMTTIYLVGLIERRNRTIARFGIDSVAILVAYAGGLFMLYQLR
ncbi:sodium:calcium antiporter [Noviherbaspirillum agri]